MSHLLPSTIKWSIEHLVRHRDTDIFPKAFEFEAINYCQDEVIQSLSKQDICQWKTRPLRRCLVPKGKYGFRIATQLDPLDMIFYLSLILEVGEQIEKSRLPANQKIAYSNRFALNESDYSVFNRNVGYPEFQEHSGDLAKKYRYVVLTDIADFYPRIYLHRVENALSSAIKTLPTHVKAIIQLIKGWNQNVSYGIPVGNNPSRLIAELVIDDVDRTLSNEGIIFTRFVDDYRIFCGSRKEAYQSLTRLANALYDVHGLTLQYQKTNILTVDEFTSEILETAERKEIRNLSKGFNGILDKIGIDDPYGIIDYNILPKEYQKQIDSLNLENLLGEQLEAEEIDISMTKFLFNRLGKLNHKVSLKKLLVELDKLYPVFNEVIRYLERLVDSIPNDERLKIGEVLLLYDKSKDSVIGHLGFHRMLIMSLFASSIKWGNTDKLPKLYDTTDGWFRRKLLIAIGKASQDYWLRSKKLEMERMSIWEKRAFLYAASCFPEDEKENYYRAVKSQLDDLEKYVVMWASKCPINK